MELQLSAQARPMRRPTSRRNRRSVSAPSASRPSGSVGRNAGYSGCSGFFGEALESRVLLSATSPAVGWQARPIAMPHYFQTLPQARKTATATAGAAASSSASSSTSLQPSYAGSSTAYGLTPAQVRGAYGVTGISFNGVVGDGSGQTIAITDAYDYPTALTDLNAFSTKFGLPTFNSGAGSPTFTKLNQSGGTSLPSADPAGPYSSTGGGDWEQEEALDIEWAHAIAPKANLVLYEASDSGNGLFAAVATARKAAGVAVVSMSWGGSEFSGESNYDTTYFTTPAGHAGVTFVASSDDEGAYSPGTTNLAVSYPAASPKVLAVGGTSLSVSGTSYGSESGWGNGTSSGTAGGSGGGISRVESQPAYQVGTVTQSTTRRAVPDVAMLANPATGVPIYDSWDYGASTPWINGYEGGTSLSAPMWAGLVAVADQGRATAGLGSLDGATQTLPSLYKLPGSDFHDITTGNNGYAAGAGYDLVTGRGSPVADALVPALAGFTPTSTLVAPAVSGSPVSQSVVEGSTTTFGALATGNPTPTVQWQLSTDGGQTFADITGATGPTYAFTATLAQAGQQFRAIFTNSQGSAATAPATLTVTPKAPALSAFQVGDGTAQRSMVQSLTLTFDHAVTLSPGALTLTPHASSTDPAAALPALAWSSSDGGLTYVVTFNVADPTGATTTASSLPDGVYDLTVHASLVHDATAQTLIGGDQTFTFHRLFGDADGNGTVNAADYAKFRQAFGATTGSAGYNAALDYDGNGSINALDYAQFKNRFGVSVTY